MLHLVDVSGKYHGDVESPEAARKLAITKDSKSELRLLSDDDWEQVKADPDKRVELFSTLGVKL